MHVFHTMLKQDKLIGTGRICGLENTIAEKNMSGIPRYLSHTPFFNVDLPQYIHGASRCTCARASNKRSKVYKSYVELLHEIPFWRMPSWGPRLMIITKDVIQEIIYIETVPLPIQFFDKKTCRELILGFRGMLPELIYVISPSTPKR